MGFGSNPLTARLRRGGSTVGSRKKASAILYGDREIMEILEMLEPSVGKKAMRKTLRKATKDIVLPDARNRAPHDTGELEKSLTVRAMERSRLKYGYEVVSRPGSESASYAARVELGTKHRESDPFLRAALYTNHKAVQEAMIFGIKEAIRELPVSPIK